MVGHSNTVSLRDRLELLRKLDERVEFGKGVAAVERGLGFGEGRFEIACFGGESSGGVEEDRVAARAI